jgi:hypothetical protein
MSKMRSAVAAEGELVAGDGGGHAERGVAVVVAAAEAELHQLAERVDLFGDELACADDAERVLAVFLLDGGELFDHDGESLVP